MTRPYYVRGTTYMVSGPLEEQSPRTEPEQPARRIGFMPPRERAQMVARQNNKEVVR